MELGLSVLKDSRCVFVCYRLQLAFNIHVAEWIWRVLRLLVELILHRVRARLHQASASMLGQLCMDASDTVVIENNGLQPHSEVTP